MHWRVIVGAALGVAAATGGTAAADDTGAVADVEATSQELGARVGLEAGGRTSPGGLFIGGAYLYRLTEDDWLDSRVGFTFGGGGARCFRDRDDTRVCDHGLAEGFGAELAVTVRRFFPGRGAFRPFLRGGLGARMVAFSGDDVRGFAVPLIAGGGVRSQVADRIAVLGAATLRAGLGWFTRDVGIEPHATLSVQFGVEFALD